MSIDQDDEATWPQLRDRLIEIRLWAEQSMDYQAAEEVLAILNRERETA